MPQNTGREELFAIVQANTYAATDGECWRVADAILAAGFHLAEHESGPRLSDAGLRAAGNAAGQMIPMSARLEYDLKPVAVAQAILEAYASASAGTTDRG